MAARIVQQLCAGIDVYTARRLNQMCLWTLAGVFAVVIGLIGAFLWGEAVGNRQAMIPITQLSGAQLPPRLPRRLEAASNDDRAAADR